MWKRALRIVGLVFLGALLVGLTACQPRIAHTVSEPYPPSGPPAGQVGESLTFSTGGAVGKAKGSARGLI